MDTELVPDTLAAVILAYGVGARDAAAVAERCASEGVQHVLIVRSAVPATIADELADRVEALAASVQFHDLPSNLGSAGGYAAGIEAALRSFPSAETVVLLDDDNVPSRGCLVALHKELLLLDSTAIRATAPNRVGRQLEVLTRSEARDSLTQGAFLGVDLRHRLRRRSRHRVSDAALPSERRYLPWAPYGGLMLDRRAVEAIGLPDASYFLYSDDLDYTARIVRLGGVIAHVPAALIEELRPSGLWYQGSASFPQRVLGISDTARRTLWLRNEVRRHRALIGRPPRLLVNIAVTTLALCVYAAPRPHLWSALLHSLRAIAAGLLEP